MNLIIATLSVLSYIQLAFCTVPLYIQNHTVSLNTTSNFSSFSAIWADIRSPSLNCEFSTDSFISNINTTCQSHILSLQAIQQPLAPQALRLQASGRLSNCIIALLYETYYCSSFSDESSLAALWVDIGHDLKRNSDGSYPLEPAVKIDSNGSNYPEFLPMVEKACEFDFKNLTQGSCCTSPATLFNNPGAESLARCQFQAANQYVRCTAQKNFAEVQDCVVNTAVKSDWLPPGIFLYGGGTSCRGTVTIIVLAATAILIDGLGMLARIAINKIRHQDSVPQRAFSLVHLFTHLGIQIANPFLSALIFGMMGTPSSKMSNFALFLIYPRPTCIIAFVCLFVPKWRGYALQLLSADFILNLLCFGMTEFKSITTYPPNPTNPLLPAHSLYMYQKGFMVSIGTGYAVYAVLMGFTSLGALDFVAGIFSKDENYEYKIFSAVIVFWIFLALFAAALPILALAEMVVKITNFFRKKDPETKRIVRRPSRTSENHWTSMLSSELARVFGRDNSDNDSWVHPTWFSGKIWFVTILLLAAAIVSAVGNWMTTIELYGMAGEAWCPADLDEFTVLKVGLPILGHLLDVAFMAIS